LFFHDCNQRFLFFLEEAGPIVRGGLPRVHFVVNKLDKLASETKRINTTRRLHDRERLKERQRERERERKAPSFGRFRILITILIITVVVVKRKRDASPKRFRTVQTFEDSISNLGESAQKFFFSRRRERV